MNHMSPSDSTDRPNAIVIPRAILIHLCDSLDALGNVYKTLLKQGPAALRDDDAKWLEVILTSTLEDLERCRVVGARLDEKVEAIREQFAAMNEGRSDSAWVDHLITAGRNLRAAVDAIPADHLMEALCFYPGGYPPQLPPMPPTGTVELSVGKSHAKPKPSAKGKYIDERMAKKLMDDPTSFGWTAEYWSKHLQCSTSTIHGTKTWERIMTMRKLREAEKATEHKNYKPTDRRRMGKKRSRSD